MKRPIKLTLKTIPAFAKQMAEKLKGGEVLALIGPLGSGKTAFTKRLAKRLKVKTTVTSPTFVIMNTFPAKLPNNKKPVTLLHLDLYRARSIKELKALGLVELWQKKDVVTIIEWADKIKKHLPKNSIILNFRHEQIL